MCALFFVFNQTSLDIITAEDSNDRLKDPVRVQRARALNVTEALQVYAVRATVKRTEHARSLLKIFDSRLLHGWVKDIHYFWDLWRVGAEHAFYETHNQHLASRITRLCALAEADSVRADAAPAVKAVCCRDRSKYPRLCPGTSQSTACTPITLTSVAQGASRSRTVSFGSALSHRQAYTLHCLPAPPTLMYARDAEQRSRFISCQCNAWKQ